MEARERKSYERVLYLPYIVQQLAFVLILHLQFVKLLRVQTL